MDEAKAKAVLRRVYDLAREGMTAPPDERLHYLEMIEELVETLVDDDAEDTD